MKFVLLFICSLLILSLAEAETNKRQFPKSFKFGAANAASQIEGGWLSDGKSETVWDHFAHKYPEKIADHTALDIAADSYHKYKEDVAIIKALGLDIYRLSIAWARILPTGYTDQVNEQGVQYYKNLFKELKANRIEPMVTLYHWDLPQVLEDSLGGWLNMTTADLFAEYAKLCFQLFGDDVKLWITINEPKQVCQAGYGNGGFAPGVVSNGVGEYVCSYNVLLAHAKAYHIYDEQFRATQGGKVTLVIDSLWYEPGSNSDEDLEAAERALQFAFGLYGNPVFKKDWPEVVKNRIAMRSKLEGFEKSRLPEFSPEEISYISGTYDYLAVNHYSSHMVNATAEPVIGSPSYWADTGVNDWQRDEWPKANVNWFSVVPWGLRKLLVWLKNTYGDVEIVITENGLSDGNGTLNDDHRVAYYRDYLSNCLDAIYEDGVNLSTYIAWSFIDDWEWTSGFWSRIGMYYVDFDSANRTRTPKKSAGYFTNVTTNRCLVDVSDCTD